MLWKCDYFWPCVCVHCHVTALMESEQDNMPEELKIWSVTKLHSKQTHNSVVFSFTTKPHPRTMASSSLTVVNKWAVLWLQTFPKFVSRTSVWSQWNMICIVVPTVQVICLSFMDFLNIHLQKNSSRNLIAVKDQKEFSVNKKTNYLNVTDKFCDYLMIS